MNQNEQTPDTVASLQIKNALLIDLIEKRSNALREIGAEVEQLRQALDASQRIQESLTRQIEDILAKSQPDGICSSCGSNTDRRYIYKTWSATAPLVAIETYNDDGPGVAKTM